MTADNVQAKIKAKFGSVSNFLKIQSWTAYEYQKALNFPLILYKTVARINAPAKSGGLEPEKLERLRGEIEGSGGAYQFCAKNPDFAMATVCQILQGKRKRMTPKVQALFDHFGI